MKNITSVDAYIDSREKWNEELILLRYILLETELQEKIKWGMPVYTLANKNVAGFSAFKSWVGIWFFQGVFLKDPEKKLVNAQEGTTKGLRQWRLISADEIKANQKVIKQYLEEAIQNLKEGKEIKPDRNKPIEIPTELQKELESNPGLKDQFKSLSPGKQREFVEYIGSAKREETRLSRLDKVIPLILEGIGLNDKYKKIIKP